jgi:hypothetical protein
MCQRIQCSECNKPSYAGCGMHVEQVLGDVPREERCMCREKPKKREGEPSVLRRLFGL